MSGNVDGQIDAELQGMSTDQLKQALFELLKKNEARKASYNTPEAKARRKAYYEAKKNTPEWKEARSRQAAQRRAKIDALLAIAKERGIDLKELGFNA
jgi:hypothetical protein